MRTLTLFIIIFLFTSYAYSEQLDSYKASNGITYNIGDTFKLGRGSGQNGKFVYLTLGGIGFAGGGGVASQLDHTFTGSTCTIKKIRKTNDDRIIFVVGAGGLSNYNLSIEDAIATCEIVDCKKDPIPVTVVNTPSKFDELKKLKELFDSGAITEDEYKAEKEKLLK